MKQTRLCEKCNSFGTRKKEKLHVKFSSHRLYLCNVNVTRVLCDVGTIACQSLDVL